jgi:DNA-binding XRE family transcriptional regulator
MKSKYYWPIIDTHLKNFKRNQKTVAQLIDVPANVITKLKQGKPISEEESAKVDMWCVRHLRYQCKHYRDEHEMSQAALAKKIGSKQAYISMFETMNTVSEETVNKVAEYIFA